MLLHTYVHALSVAIDAQHVVHAIIIDAMMCTTDFKIWMSM